LLLLVLLLLGLVLVGGRLPASVSIGLQHVVMLSVLLLVLEGKGLQLAVLLHVQPLLQDGTRLLLLILMLVGFALLLEVLLMLLLVLMMALLLHVLMLVGGRLTVFVSRGLQTVVLLHVCVVAGVGSGAGWRPAAAPAGGAVGVVAAAGAGSWPTVVGGLDGRGASRVHAGDAFEHVGGGWRLAVATNVHAHMDAARGAAAYVTTIAASVAIVRHAAAGAGLRQASSVGFGVGGHKHVAGGRADGGAYAAARASPRPVVVAWALGQPVMTMLVN
jgi:hypothetical protein